MPIGKGRGRTKSPLAALWTRYTRERASLLPGAIIGGDDNAIDIDGEELSEIREFVVSGECALPLPQQPHASWLSRFIDWMIGLPGTQSVVESG